MTIRAGSRVQAVDFDLPDVATGFGSGANTITSATFAPLPTIQCTAAITNAHPSANMLCLVTYGAWMSASTGDVRMSLDVSGALTIAPGIGGGAAIGWGEVPMSASTANAQFSATFTAQIPPGTTTFKTYALRTGAGTVACNYPTIRLVPLYFLA